MKKNFSPVAICAADDQRKAAFATFNRGVNLDNAKAILEVMKSKGYKDAETIQVMPAEKAVEKGDVELTDINGNPIDVANAKEYYLVLDGQHRTIAVAMYNSWAEAEEKEPLTLPAVIVELKDDESVVEYINEINITKKEWVISDYVRGAFNVNPDDEFLRCFNHYIKSDVNKNGAPLSTLCLIFCGKSTAIAKKDFSQLCSGITEKGRPNVRKPIIPSHNLENGKRFIDLCLSKGFKMQEIAKRYLITEFNDIKMKTGNVEAAFKVFEAITPNDKAAMYNAKEKIDEGFIIEQFKKINKRLSREKTVISNAA